MSGKRLWHYTSGEHAASIIKEGAIRPTEVLIEKGERPAVWLSSNPIWESTATKGIIVNGVRRNATFAEMEKHAGGCYRIEVAHSETFITWDQFRRVSGISNKMWRALGDAGVLSGAKPASEWWASFDPITSDNWLSIQRRNIETMEWHDTE